MMSLPRLAFLYPALRCRPPSLATLRYRHGTAVEPPAQLNADPPPVPPSPPPPPPPPRTGYDSESKGKLGRSFLDGGATGKGLRGRVTEALLETAAGGVQQAGKTTDGAAAGSTTTTATATTTTTAETLGDGSSNGTTTPSPTSSSPSSSSSSTAFAPGEYLHHFDTYSSVQKLEAGGYRRGQSVAIMKGIRSLLDKNMTAARENLVSKSDIENETYLFQAACSELRNEMQNAKKAQMDQLRSERTRIQTEFDLLNQAFLAEMMTLKDELNGMFNDRKMVTRAEQRAMENKIQELNYKITILIQSELKSEIEKLRWITTRRGLIAIASLALFVVASIRVNNSSSEKKRGEHKEKERRRREEEEPEAERQHYKDSRVVAGAAPGAGPVAG